MAKKSLMPKLNKVVFKKNLKGCFAETDMRTGVMTLNKSKYKGIEAIDTYVHEKNHLSHPKMSERDVINKTKKDVESLIAII